MRSLVLALVLGLLFVTAAEAKLDPTFSQRIAKPGDRLTLDVGEGGAQFMGPLRIFLVSLDDGDRSQIKLGELGTPGRFDVPRILRFEVPDVPAGDYTVAIWFRGSETGRWTNALEGIDPLLTIRAGERGASPAPLWAIAITAGGLGAGLLVRRARLHQPVDIA